MTGRPDRTTDRTRKAVELAVTAAGEFGARAVDSRHLLCGLLRQAEGVAFHVLDNLGVTASKVDEMLAADSPSETNSPMTLDADVRSVMVTASDCSSSMGHNHIGTEHLLLGVVAPGTNSSKLLAELGIQGEAVTHEIYGLLGRLP